MSSKLVTYTGQRVMAKYDALLYNAMVSDGSIYGLEVNASPVDSNGIIIGNGYGIIQGRFFEVEQETVYAELSGGTEGGQIIISMDLSNTDTPLTIEVDMTNRDLRKDANVNIIDGTYEVQLATFSAESGSIIQVTKTFSDSMGASDVQDNLEQARRALNLRITNLADSTVFWQEPTDTEG